MSFEKINVPSVRESFVRQIENRIISGELKVGDKLPPAKELCAIMGVSLTVVNAGMSELAGKGFVETVPRRGTYVADYKRKGNTETFVSIMRYNGGTLTSTEVRSFIETRLALDPFVATLVCERAGKEELAELAPLLDAIRAETDCRRLCELVTGFYHRIAVISGNTFMALLYHSSFEPQCCVYRMYFEKNGSESTVATCEKVYELLCAGNAPAVRQLMTAALNTALEGPKAVV